MTIPEKVLLTFERDEDGEFIVTDDFSVVYGNGKTALLALSDYCVSLEEYLEATAPA